MRVAIELPDTVLLTEADQGFLEQGLVALLYTNGKCSEKEACDMLGLSRREFEALLPKFGFSILGDDPENLAIELSA